MLSSNFAVMVVNRRAGGHRVVSYHETREQAREALQRYMLNPQYTEGKLSFRYRYNPDVWSAIYREGSEERYISAQVWYRRGKVPTFLEYCSDHGPQQWDQPVASEVPQLCDEDRVDGPGTFQGLRST